jgi:hypothetical protein
MPSLTPVELAEYNDSKKPELYGAFAVLLALTNAVVFVRMYGQFKIWRRLLVEDYLILFAIILSSGIIAAYLVGVSYGLGQHEWKVLASDPKHPQNIVNIFKIVWISAVINGPCFLAIKLSLLYFYRRLFFTNSRWFQIAWWANYIYAVLWAIGSTLFFILQCSPIDYYWNRVFTAAKVADFTGSCVSGQANIGVPLITSTISDFTILFLPVSSLWSLQISTRKKIGLMFLFSLGLFACACGLIRFVLILNASTSTDPTWNITDFLVWSSAEECIGIICACIPSIASLFQLFLKRNPPSRKTNEFDTFASSRPKYLTVQDPQTDNESVHGLRGPDSQYELHDRGLADKQTSGLRTRADDWKRTIEATHHDARHEHMPEGQIKVDTHLEWRSDKASVE